MSLITLPNGRTTIFTRTGSITAPDFESAIFDAIRISANANSSPRDAGTAGDWTPPRSPAGSLWSPFHVRHRDAWRAC